jgi:stress response protein YsnF
MDRETVIPVIAEEVHAGVRTASGGVRVRKTVKSEEHFLRQSLASERLDVERVAVNRIVDGPQPVREEGDTVIIPVMKQVVRVDWVVVEEIRITRTQEHTEVSHPVTLLREDVEIEALPPEQTK